MNITATTGSDRAFRPEGPSDGLGRQRMDDVMAAVAKKVGMSDDELHSALGGGSSLADIARDRGVSKSDLVDTIRKAITDPPPGPGSSAPAKPPSEEQVNRIAERLADRHVRRHPLDNGQGPGPNGVVPPTDTTTTSETAIANGRIDMRL